MNFAETKVLMLATTGKAAYNIKGNTIHNAIAIPACQSLRNYKSLDSSRLNTLRCQIGGVKLIFIDEISMVGNTMFNVQINNRPKDIKDSSLPVGGVSIEHCYRGFIPVTASNGYKLYSRTWIMMNMVFLLPTYGKNVSKCLNSNK